MFDSHFAFGVALAALLICVVNLVYTLIEHRTDKVQNKIYIIIISILIINSVSLLWTADCKEKLDTSELARVGIYVSRYIYFATHTALCPMFFYYVCSVSGVQFRLSNLKSILLSMFFVITEFLALTNPVTRVIYTVDDDYGFHRNWGEYLIYLAAAVYYVMTFVILFSSWDVLSGKRRLAMVFFFLLAGSGVLVQLFMPDFKIEILTEAIGFTGVLVAVENEDDRIDFGMGFYNRAALNLDMKSCVHNIRLVSLIIIRISNTEIVSKMTGKENMGIISDIVGGYLTSIVKRYNIYVPNPDTFVLAVYDKSVRDVEKMAQEISEKFDTPWEYGDMNIPLYATLMLTDIPGRISSGAELFYMIDSPLPKDIDKKILSGADLDYLIRRQAVESAVSRGLDENSFEVYYQPTYHVDGKLHGAEALLRMHDSKLGNVFPDEFIPVAEQIGLIDDIDDYVLDCVCKFVKTGVPQKYGMDSINVNLSVMQCMKPGFVERVSGIVESNGVDKHFINFEITESIAASDYRILSNVIKRLKADGFMFSMDDYGTGYSNVSAVFSLNLDVVKIDKSLLWNAEKDELGMVILENTIRMIQQIKKKILVEGVETISQIELLKYLKVDYLQGFYYSKPIPKDDFVKLISQGA
ncbi:MAG: EAL domain-containing protein [Lachnospiraceae bacterium]|nr:EAL domain-containing protein [Lachnospiraceae bacterium]